MPKGQYAREPIETRFFNSVDKTDTCWLWTSAIDGTGRGTIKYNGKSTGAHRVSWILHNGEIPLGLSVCHECDNPVCVNPKHLFLGTHKDNMQDMTSKNRQAKGVKQGSSKLSPEDVISIRKDVRTQVEIASSYGIAQVQVSRIKRHAVWAHL